MAGGRDAYYHFSAAQAHFYLEDYPSARDALRRYFKGVESSGDHHGSARTLSLEIEKVLRVTPVDRRQRFMVIGRPSG